MELKETVLTALGRHKQVVLYTVGAGASLLGLWLGYKYVVRKPKKLTQVGVVSQLLLHPLKSGKALQIATAECLRMGLKYGELRDRCVNPPSSHNTRVGYYRLCDGYKHCKSYTPPLIYKAVTHARTSISAS